MEPEGAKIGVVAESREGKIKQESDLVAAVLDQSRSALWRPIGYDLVLASHLLPPPSERRKVNRLIPIAEQIHGAPTVESGDACAETQHGAGIEAAVSVRTAAEVVDVLNQICRRL